MLDEMMADAAAAKPEELLGRIGKLAEYYSELESAIKEAEAQVKELKERARVVAERDLPEAMAEVGMASFTLSDGSQISVKPFYSASINDGNREACFEWLENHGFADIIKNEFTIKLGKGDSTEAERIGELFANNDIDYSQKMAVAPQTLTAFVKEQVENGAEFPLELFNVYIGQIAKIKRSK